MGPLPSVAIIATMSLKMTVNIIIKELEKVIHFWSNTPFDYRVDYERLTARSRPDFQLSVIFLATKC